MATIGLFAQQISVVSTGGETSLYKSLQEAVDGASDGSVVYLPGGGFGKKDTVTVTKKLTIIGIGHYAKNENVDGATTINGSIHFNAGSDGSALLGCYITGTVCIGADGSSVNNVLVRYCNAARVNVMNSSCEGTMVNQCYLRSNSDFNEANGYFTNNIAHSIILLNNGFIENNIFYNSYVTSYAFNLFGTTITTDGTTTKIYCRGSVITGNVIIGKYNLENVIGCQISNNIYYMRWEDDNIYEPNIAESTYNFFENSKTGISPLSNFHFKGNYVKYENQVGIYAGTGFNDQQLAPVPYIVNKKVDEQTDAQGKLNVKIRVKAGQ